MDACLAATAPVVAVGSTVYLGEASPPHANMCTCELTRDAHNNDTWVRHPSPCLGRWRIQMCIYDNPSPAQAHRHDNAHAAVVRCRLPACASDTNHAVCQLTISKLIRPVTDDDSASGACVCVRH